MKHRGTTEAIHARLDEIRARRNAARERLHRLEAETVNLRAQIREDDVREETLVDVLSEVEHEKPEAEPAREPLPTSTFPDGLSMRGFIRTLIASAPEFLASEIIKAVQRYRPETSIATIRSEISWAARQGHASRLGEGRYQSRLYRQNGHRTPELLSIEG